MGWRHSFGVLGCLGAIWAAVFYWWYRDDPRDNPRLNAAEREPLRESATLAKNHANVPWVRMLGSWQVWLLCWQYFFLSYGWWFYITWLPTYLVKGRHLAASAAWAIRQRLRRLADYALDGQRDTVAAHHWLHRVHRSGRFPALLHHAS